MASVIKTVERFDNRNLHGYYATAKPKNARYVRTTSPTFGPFIMRSARVAGFCPTGLGLAPLGLLRVWARPPWSLKLATRLFGLGGALTGDVTLMVTTPRL